MQSESKELKQLDAEIEALERMISVRQEQRREIINRNDLNKINIEVKDIECILDTATRDAIRRSLISEVCGRK